jgi:lipoprotein-releasing system ATP-binding protein
MPALIELDQVRKTYNAGAAQRGRGAAWHELQVDKGEFIALIGPSGSGKSTLLNIVGLLERMTSGSYRLQGEEVHALDDAALTLRRRNCWALCSSSTTCCRPSPRWRT